MSMTIKEECFICIEKVSEKTITKCPYCDFVCCNNCFKQHIKTTLKTEKNCMNCKKRFTRVILISMMGKSYIDKLYKEHIGELIFKEEKMLIPRSLPELERRQGIKLSNENSILRNNDFITEINNGNIVIDTIEYFEKKYLNLAHDAYFKAKYSTPLTKNDEVLKIKQYKFPCENSQCNGFVDSSWHCALCNMNTCKECHTIKQDNHECKQEDIDTAILIKKDSKPCPKCNISIMKSSGCDQMWCVSCHTTFDWKTLVIKTSGVLHNPEYFRYMRENGIAIPRNPNDNNPCDNNYTNTFNMLSNINKAIIDMKKIRKNNKDIVTNGEAVLIEKYTIQYLKNHPDERNYDKINILAKEYSNTDIKNAEESINKLSSIDILNKNYIAYLFNLYRDINHIEGIELPYMRRKIDEHNISKDNLRLMYLEKIITEKSYKSSLLKMLKEVEFLDESIGFQTSICEVCKAYFINKVYYLQDEIDSAVNNKNKLILYNCKSYIRMRDFIKDIINNCENVKKMYGYTRMDNYEIKNWLSNVDKNL
jgi:hypothetical protein